ncbi:MAG TPA: hypothetical protein VKR06_25910, partial [Ktedonosporobacter sp.]|nr:hypothetical protein [Ktedonosporobacter sp.]
SVKPNGHLREAERLFRQSIALAESCHDLHLILWYSLFALVLQQLSSSQEAVLRIKSALRLSRESTVTPYKGQALLALGSMRLFSARFLPPENRLSHLKRARKSLQHALGLTALEKETRIEAQIILSEVLFYLAEVESAHALAEQSLIESDSFHLIWLRPRAHRVLSVILASLGQQDKADWQFQQATLTATQTSMRLEYGRSLHQYGEALLSRNKSHGLGYLQQARQIFVECEATLDVERLEYDLSQLPSGKSDIP